MISDGQIRSRARLDRLTLGSGKSREAASEASGRQAAAIGTVVADHPGRVYLRSSIGGLRIVDMLSGEQLPRIC